MSACNTVTEVEMREVGAGIQGGLKRIRSTSEERKDRESKHEEPKNKVTRAENSENSELSKQKVDSTSLILQKIEALSESFNTRLSAIETSTKNTECQVNDAFSMMRKDIDEVKSANQNNAKDIREIKEQLQKAP